MPLERYVRVLRERMWVIVAVRGRLRAAPLSST